MSDETPSILVRIVGATDVGLIREHNEDNFIVVDLSSGETNFLEPREVVLGKKGTMLVVCDGMGGAAAGEVASHMAVESMRRQMLQYVTEQLDADGKVVEPPSGAPSLPQEAQNESVFLRMSRWLRDSTARANLEIWEAACADLSKNGMGTTLTGLVMLGSQIVVSQIGDSRAYLCRQGVLTQITHDQSLVNQLLDSGQITPEQAKLFEHSNVILQALGVQEDIEVVLSSETVRRGDRMLLCSDGLVGVVTDEEIQEVMASTEDLGEAARKLIDLARSGGGPDNITVILAQAEGEGLAVPTAEEHAKYQVMTLPGEKPIERRPFGEGYQFGSPAGSTSNAPDLVVARPDGHRVSLVMWAALFTLIATLVVLAVVLLPKRFKAPQRALCSVLVEPAGMEVWVDPSQSPTPLFKTSNRNEQMTVELGVGQHVFVLRSPEDRSVRSASVVVQVAAGQPCNLKLSTLPTVEFASDFGTAGDAGSPADAGTKEADAASVALDAGTDLGMPTVPGVDLSVAVAEGSDEESTKKTDKKPRNRRSKDKAGPSVAPVEAPPMLGTPAGSDGPTTPGEKTEPPKTDKPADSPKPNPPEAKPAAPDGKPASPDAKPAPESKPAEATPQSP